MLVLSSLTLVRVTHALANAPGYLTAMAAEIQVLAKDLEKSSGCGRGSEGIVARTALTNLILK